MSDHDRPVTDDTDETTDEQTTDHDGAGAGPSLSRRATLTTLGLTGLLGPGIGTASADPQGQVGTESDPLQALYTEALDGGVTGDQSVTSLTGDGLTVDSGALSAAPARPDVDASGTSVENVPGIEFGEGLTVTDEDDGTVTVGLDADRSLSLSVAGFDVGERGTGDTFTVDATVTNTGFPDFDNLRTTVEDATVTLTVTDPAGSTVYDEQLTTDVQPGGALVTFGVDDGTSEVGPLNTGDHTATVTVEAANVDSGTATDTFTVRESSLSVALFSVPDKGTESPLTVDATVEETDGNRTEGLTVDLAIEAPDGTTVYDATVDPGSELDGESTTVTFGEDDGTSAVGPLDTTGEYTATVTVDTTNGGLATAGDAFSVRAGVHHTAPADLERVLAGMAQDDDGTYVVTDDHELQAMNADTSADYRLGTDIDASLTAQWNDGDGFVPVGPEDDTFAGSFDGNDRVVTGLTIDRARALVGLFGRTRSGSTIETVSLETVEVTGFRSVGGLVGDNSGTVRESSANGEVSGRGDVGGLVGVNDGTVRESSATGSIDGASETGGLVGTNDGTVRESYATGSVDGSRRAGGFVGRNLGTVRESYATGSVDGDSQTGGLVAANINTVTDGYWDTESTTQNSGIGAGDSGDVTGLTTSEMRGDEAQTNMTGLDFSAVWATVDADTDADVTSDDYPVLQALDRQAQLTAGE